MTENEWQECGDPRRMLEAIQGPTDHQLTAFSAACCRRIWSLIMDDESHRAIEFLESQAESAQTPQQIAVAANAISCDSSYFSVNSSVYDATRNHSAAKAVGYAVRHLLPPTHINYSKDRLASAIHTALFAQFAVGKSVSTDDDSDYDPNDEDPGADWLVQQTESAEAVEQCKIIRSIFPSPGAVP